MRGAGLMVTERNWLEVYPYASWGGNSNLPHFTEGQTFMPSSILLHEARCGGHATHDPLKFPRASGAASCHCAQKLMPCIECQMLETHIIVALVS